MILSYLRLAFRLILRNPFFTFINVAGLAIGFASFYILWNYAITELRSDQYHKDYDRIARIGYHWRWTDDGGKTWGHEINGNIRANIFPGVKDDFSEVESTLRVLYQDYFGSDLVNHGEEIAITNQEDPKNPKVFKEVNVVYTDPNLFTFFSIPVLYGDPASALNNANYVALSSSTSKKYFGDIDPTGKLLTLNDSITLKVGAVFEDLPHNSHLRFDIAISNLGLENKWQACARTNAVAYVKLANSNFEDLQARLVLREPVYFADVRIIAPNCTVEMFVQPLEDIVFSENFEGDRSFHAKSRSFLSTLAFIAISVLIMAWINYVNLTMIRVKYRLKEIAARKAVGAVGSDLLRQFVTESLTINVISLLVAATIVQLVRRPMELFFNIPVADLNDLNVNFIIITLLFFAGGVLMTGLYSYFMTSVRNQSTGKNPLAFVLTTGQISVAIIFMLFGLVISLQLDHVLSRSTGINKEAVIIVEAPVNKPADYKVRIRSLKQELTRVQNVEGVTLSRSLFNTGINFENYTMTRRIGSDLSFGADKNFVDEDFISFYGLKLMAGRNFVDGEKDDRIVVSRIAAQRLGFDDPNDAVDAPIEVMGQVAAWGNATIIGVFEDYRTGSFLKLKRSDADGGRGIVLRCASRTAGLPERLSIRINNTTNLSSSIDEIRNLLQSNFPDNPFVWYFLDAQMSTAYFNETAARNQVIMFTVLAIVISCLGLIGTISNKVTERVKEIGIRKILGATLTQIIQLLLKTTTFQLIFAAFIGIPVAYFMATEYLQKYTTTIELRWWHFVLPLPILTLIVMTAVGKVVWSAANSNPVEALKHN